MTFAPPDRRKLPSCTVRTRSIAGSNTIVNVTVESRWAPVTEIGMLYGPCPTRSGVAGGEMITCAWPMPGELIGGLASCGGAPAAARRRRRERRAARTGGAACACGGAAGGAGGGGAGGGGVRRRRFGTTTVPGIGVAPGGTGDRALRRGCCPIVGSPLAGRRRAGAGAGRGRVRGRRRREQRRRAADAEALLRADVDRPQIGFGDVRARARCAASAA